MTNIADNLFIRIDDRLIHGQVMTTWVRSLSSKSIWVVSDRAASEPLEIILLKSSVPAHMSLEVYTVEQALIAFERPPAVKTLVLMERLQDVAALCSKQDSIRDVNLGGLRYRPGKESLSKSVYVSPEEKLCLKQLDESGVKVWVQIVPSDAKFLAVERL